MLEYLIFLSISFLPFFLTCLYRRAWYRDYAKGRMMPMIIPKSKMQTLDPKKRAHKYMLANCEKNAKLKVLDIGEPLEASIEANIRHEMRQFYPFLKLRPQSITNGNYLTVKQRFPESFKPHPKKEPAFKEDRLCTNAITWEKECEVYVVYGMDVCRGELEKEENTVDEPSAGNSYGSSSSSPNIN